MSPLQRIAMGMLFLASPAGFQIGDYVWDGLSDPLGWLLILSGLGRLAGFLDIAALRWVARIAFAASIPQAVPPLFDLLLPDADPVARDSIHWAFFLPQAVFSLMLCRDLSRLGLDRRPPDRFVGSRFGTLSTGFALLIVLPAVAFSTGIQDLIDTTLIAIGLLPFIFVYYLFRAHARPWLGGPVPPASPVDDEGRPPSP